jgi:hypothetical protein
MPTKQYEQKCLLKACSRKHKNKIEKQNFTHKPCIHIQNNTQRPIIVIVFHLIFHELSTQPSIQHGSPTLSLSLKFLESLWVVDKWLNWYWIVIGALFEFSILFNYAPFIFFLNILILMWISILASCSTQMFLVSYVWMISLKTNREEI